MARSPRADEAGGIYHALNRANMGMPIFNKEGDFLAFEKVLAEALQRYQVELFSFQIMSNHWHLVLRSLVDGEMGRFCKWVGGTHTMRYHAHYRTAGQTLVDDEVRGRVSSIWGMVAFGGTALGGLAVGFAATIWGLQNAVIVSGMLCLVAAALSAVRRN